MYNPKGNGKDKAVKTVAFVEMEPPEHQRGIVHRFLELKTNGTLPEDYKFHALPDACTYVVFDQLQPLITGASQLRATSEEFNLGRRFHFINIRFLPGVWQFDRAAVNQGIVDQPYVGDLPFVSVNQSLKDTTLETARPILVQFVDQLMTLGLVAANPLTAEIFRALDDIHTVADMAEHVSLSPRQLQRNLKRTTGFAPHDFLKILRLQQSLNGSDTWSYADQSHFIHSFRNATGYTPGKYTKKFDV